MQGASSERAKKLVAALDILFEARGGVRMRWRCTGEHAGTQILKAMGVLVVSKFREVKL